jgi:uncharacterized protein
MTMQLQKPILIGGLALSAGFLGLDSLHHILANAGDTLILGTMAAGGGYWWWSTQKGQKNAIPPAVVINPATLQHLTVQVQIVIDRLTTEGAPTTVIEQLQQQLQQATSQSERPSYQVAVTGKAKVGKTSIIQDLESHIGQPQYNCSKPPHSLAPSKVSMMFSRSN